MEASGNTTNALVFLLGAVRIVVDASAISFVILALAFGLFAVRAQ